VGLIRVAIARNIGRAVHGRVHGHRKQNWTTVLFAKVDLESAVLLAQTQGLLRRSRNRRSHATSCLSVLSGLIRPTPRVPAEQSEQFVPRSIWLLQERVSPGQDVANVDE
jgi:hypothetical protein